MKNSPSHKPKPPPLRTLDNIRKPAPPPPPPHPANDVKVALALADAEAQIYDAYLTIPLDIDTGPDTAYQKPRTFEEYSRAAMSPEFRLGWHAALAHIRHHMGLP